MQDVVGLGASRCSLFAFHHANFYSLCNAETFCHHSESPIYSFIFNKTSLNLMSNIMCQEIQKMDVDSCVNSFSSKNDNVIMNALFVNHLFFFLSKGN